MIKIGQIILKGVNWVHKTEETAVFGQKLRFLRNSQQLSSFKLKNCTKST